jgi:hypothetical protein
MLGFMGEFHFSNALGIAAELNYSQQGTATTNAEYKLNYLKLPVLLTLHDNNFMVQAGLYGAVLLKGKAEYGNWTEDVTGRFANTDMGLSLGLGYSFSGNTCLASGFKGASIILTKALPIRKLNC